MANTLTAVVNPGFDTTRSERYALHSIFAPKNVAIVGATEKYGSVGRTVLWNLISSPFGGTVFPINPNRSSVLGIRAYPRISAVPEPVDLAVFVTAAPHTPQLVGEAVDSGVKGAIIISAGFKEIGEAGAELEQQILEQARRNSLRIIGPNCLGVMNPHTGLNATFAAGIARPGNVGFISQSGALCTAVLDWSFRENVGFSAFVSIGSMLDVNWGDLIYYLGDDPNTQSIVMYMETIGDARSFLSAAREVALTKPIIVIKPGRTEGAAKAAASHTGSLTGSDEVLEAAFRRSGVLRVNDIADLFAMAEVLSKQPRPKGPRLTIVTNAGGPGVLATDALITSGGELTEISPEALQAFNAILPPHWSHNNPIDVIGDASPARYVKALEIAANDPNADGLLVILTPQAMTEPTQTAEALAPYAMNTGKPILASWMGGQDVEAGEHTLNKAGIPTFGYPDTAARVFTYMWKSAYNLRGIYETPVMPQDTFDCAPERALAEQIIRTVREAGRTILTEFESKQLLAAYCVPIVPTHIATSEAAAVQAADQMGYPIVLKLYSETITHKTDVGGVQLNLKDADAVRSAYREIQAAVTQKVGAQHFQGVTVQPMIDLEGYELIIGSSIDPQFGPVLLFGSGGQLVEVYKDRSLALPPLNTTLARRMIEQTVIYKALKGVRGRPPIDLTALEQLLVRFSQLVVEQPWIKEIDINPLLALPDQLIALDARVVLHGPTMTDEQLPKLAIRPYPIQYVGEWQARSGELLTLRPIRPEDEPLMVKFHEALSDRTVYMRFLQPLQLSQRIAHERLSRICFIDYDREIALVAERTDAQTGERIIVGVARLSKAHGTSEAQLSIVVSDHYQGRGVGKELVRRLIQVGRDERLTRITASISRDNIEMQRVAEKLGFRLPPAAEGERVTGIIDL
ncbi:MAG TPA: bifunctional acetate--CoA ligase family protein/GNAT family N-acetyltransferase [Anaerolineae bacterium]|nr:bifunctional acetate--CoA ligase family protein/GNAT family N-acetyltransferase [Anaerolineae bacterium]